MLDIKAKDLEPGHHVLHSTRWLKLDTIAHQAQAPFVTLEAEGRVWETHRNTVLRVTKFPECNRDGCTKHNVDEAQWPYCSDRCYKAAESRHYRGPRFEDTQTYRNQYERDRKVDDRLDDLKTGDY